MKSKNIRNTKKKTSKNYFAVLSTVAVMSTMLASMPTEVMASNPSQTITFANNLQQSQSKTINIPDLVRVENISTDNGNVSYSISGDNLTINVAGGTATGTQYNATKFSKSATKSTTSSTDSFASTTSYSDGDGYAGTLSKSGASYLVSGSYTPTASKTATDSQTKTSNSFPATVSYNSGGYSGTLSKSGSVTTSTQATGGYYRDTGYWDETGYYQSTGYYEETGYYKDTGYYDEYESCTYDPYNGQGASCTTRTRFVKTGSVWVSTGTKWVSTGSTWVSTGSEWISTGQEYVTTYTTYYTQNYSGTVTKPASDTRVYGQNYAGTAYKSGYDNLYGYNVTVEVVTDIIPPAPATYSPNTTAPTNGNVTLGINYASDAVVKQYKIGDTGTWTAYTAPLTLTANTVVYARSADDAGNMSTANSFTVSNIDKVAPTTPTLSADKTAPVNTDVKVSATFPNDSVKNEVRKDNGTWVVYSTEVNFTANGKLEARSTDNAGNVSAVSAYNVTNIDKVAPTTPTLSADKSAPVNTDVKVSVTFPMDSVKNEVRKDNGTWVVYSTEVNFTANGKLEARSTDNAGNVSAVGTYNVSNIDKTAPVNATLSASTTAPTNENVSVTISYPADASVKQYKVGTTGTWTDYTVQVVVSSNNTVYARSYDAVGNLSSESSLIVSNIDKVAPTTPSLSADKTAPVNTDVKVSVTFPTDSVKNEVRKDSGSWVVYSTSVNFTANGKLEARSTDNAGNVSAVGTYNVSNIDKTAPVNATLSASTTAPTNENVDVTVSYPADASVKQYKVGTTGTWMPYTVPVELTSNNTVYARSFDAVGNLSSEASLAVSNIDKVAPITPTLSADKTAPVNTDVEVSVTFPNDSVKNEVRKDNGTWVVYSGAVNFTANGKLEARSTDNAGNVSAVGAYNVTNIDKVAPTTPSLSADKTAPVNTDVKVSVTFPADSVKNEVRKDNGTWVVYSGAVNFTANGKLEARSTDNASNVSAVGSYNVTNIDKVAPTQPTVTSVENQNTISVSGIADAYAGVKETRYRLNGGAWTVYTSTLSLPDGQYTVDVVVEDKAGNVSPVKTISFDLYENRLGEASESIPQAESTRLQSDVDSARALVNDMPASPEKTSLTNRLDEVQRQIDAKEAIDKAVASDTLVDFNQAQGKNDTITNETVKALLQAELDTQKAYLDRLVEAEKLVTTAETVKTQTSVDSARDYVNTLEADEQAPLDARLDDVQDVINAKTAIELASKTRNPVDVQIAKDKIELLDQTNPVVVVIMDEMTNDFETADILSLVSKERYDVLLAKYKMTKVAYNSLVQSYYAIKYTGDSMYKMADEKFKLVPSTDAHYDLVQSQYDNLNIDYTEFVEERTASDAELRANSAVLSLEKNYIVSMVPSVQLLVDAVEDEKVQAELEARMSQAKLAYEQKLRDEALTRAETLVLNAEKYKYETYVTMAQKEVSALPEGELKDSLQARLDVLKPPALALDQAIAKAKTDIGFATKYRYEYYFKRAQSSINLVTDDTIRAELQAQLDALK